MQAISVYGGIVASNGPGFMGVQGAGDGGMSAALDIRGAGR